MNTPMHAAGRMLLLGSLLLLIIGGTEWVRSWQRTDLFMFFMAGGRMQAIVFYKGRGAIVLSNLKVWDRNWSILMAAGMRNQLPPDLADLDSPAGQSWSMARFAVVNSTLTTDMPSSYVALEVPCWFLVTIGLIVPLRVLRERLRRRGWKKAGFCLNCGYDLRAGHERCPECGSIVKESPSL